MNESILNLSFNDSLFGPVKRAVCCPCDPAQVQALIDKWYWLCVLATITVGIFVLDVVYSRLIKKKEDGKNV